MLAAVEENADDVVALAVLEKEYGKMGKQEFSVTTHTLKHLHES